MRVNNLENTNRHFTKRMGNFSVLEYDKDLSVNFLNAESEYFSSKMGVHRRQLVIDMNGSNTAVVQAGAMQWMAGNVVATSGVKGVGDFLGKALRGAVTKESAVKPEYKGSGILVLEPTYKHILLVDVEQWGSGITIEDGMFYACDGTVRQSLVSRRSLSTIELNNDEIRIDGDMAVCWSSSLQFTVEMSTRSIVGSAVSGEGLVNVYRGTGRVMISPVARTDSWSAATSK